MPHLCRSGSREGPSKYLRENRPIQDVNLFQLFPKAWELFRKKEKSVLAFFFRMLELFLPRVYVGLDSPFIHWLEHGLGIDRKINPAFDSSVSPLIAWVSL